MNAPQSRRFANARHGRYKPGIHEDVALRRGDEKRTDAGRADVMDVADEAKRLERRVPRFPFLFDGRVFGGVLFGQGRLDCSVRQIESFTVNLMEGGSSPPYQCSNAITNLKPLRLCA